MFVASFQHVLKHTLWHGLNDLHQVYIHTAVFSSDQGSIWLQSTGNEELVCSHFRAKDTETNLQTVPGLETNLNSSRTYSIAPRIDKCVVSEANDV